MELNPADNDLFAAHLSSFIPRAGDRHTAALLGETVHGIIASDPCVAVGSPPCIFIMWHTATRWRGRPQPPWSIEAVKKRRSPRPDPT
jgi:hypothetical protein